MEEKLSVKKIIEKKCFGKNIPFYAALELTYQCNHSCRHCYVVRNGNNELTFNEITSILDQLVELGTVNLIFTGGEIFTRRDFFDLCHYSRRKGFALTLMTNGSMITEKEADRLKEIKPVGIEISLLGATPETHDFITTVPGSFNRTIKAIKLLVERNIFVITKTVLMKLNVREYKAIKSLSEGLGAHPNIGLGVIPMKDSSTQPQELDLSWDEKIIHISGEDLKMSFLPEYSDALKKLICKAGRSVAAISPYGEVQPCILMPLPLGNLREKSFKEIWYSQHNEKLNHLRRLTANEIYACSKCKFISFCVRCPGVAYMETNTFHSPSPIACENAKWRAYQQGEKIGEEVRSFGQTSQRVI